MSLFPCCGEDVQSAPLPPIVETEPIRIRIPEGHPSGMPPTMVVNGADNLKELIGRERRCMAINLPPATKLIMGRNALPIVDDDHFPKLKENVCNMFTKEKIAGFAPIIKRHVEHHIEKWLKDGDNSKNVVTFAVCQDIVIDIMLELTLGCGPDDPKYTEIFKAVKIAGSVLLSIPSDDPDSDFQKGMAARKLMDAYMDEKMSTTESESNNYKTVMEMFIDISRRNDGSIDTDKVKDGCIGLILTSNLSPCGLMTNVIHLVGTHPQVKEKIREELNRHGLMDESAKLTYDAIPKLDYLSYCMKEVLRLVPVVPATFRKVVKDQKLEEFRLPKDYTLIYHFAETLAKTNSKLKDGEKFIPERWFPENIKQEAEATSPEAMTVKKLMETKECHHTPFGYGPRSCPAADLGVTITSMFTVELVSRSDWDILNPDTPMTLIPVAMPNDFVPALFRRL